MVGYTIWEVRGRMEAAAAKIVIPPAHHGSAV
jgi:hypothetical protein